MEDNGSAPATAVIDNAREQRFEARVGGMLAVAEYRRNGNVITFTHTEVPDEMQGGGVGSALARAALDAARARNLTVVARCPFIARYIERHPEYQSLLGPAA